MKKVRMSSLVVPGSSPHEVMAAQSAELRTQVNAPPTPAEPMPPPPLVVAEGPPRTALGPPPPPVETPAGYAGYMQAALKARSNPRTSYAEFWAQMAQADALERIASELGRLNTFLGAHDRHQDPAAGEPRLVDALADGVVVGALGIKDELFALVPPELLEQVKAELATAIMEKMSDKKPAKKKS